MPRIMLHIGAHKTGTKYIQATLQHVYNRYKPANDLLLMQMGNGTRAFRKAFADVHQPDVERDEAWIDAARRALGAIRNEPAIMSDEVPFGRHGHMGRDRLYPDTPAFVARLDEVFEGHEVELILFIRRQDALVESWYMQQLADGNFLPFDGFLASLPADGLRWSPVVRELSAGRCVRAVHVFPFPALAGDGKEFLRAFFRLIGLDEAWTDAAPEQPINESLSATAVEIARFMFPRVEPADYYLLRNALRQTLPSSKYGRVPTLENGDRERLVERYREDNRAVLAAHCPLPEHHDAFEREGLKQ